MRYKTKEDIIIDMSTKKCWNINKDLAIKATQYIPKGRFLIYSTMHYVTIYSIIKAKLAEIKDPIQKYAYLDCLSMNYLDMGSERINAGLDIATGVLSGTVLGLSITDLNFSNMELAYTVLTIIAIQAVKAINLSFRKWNFYQLVLSKLKEELPQKKEDQHELDTSKRNPIG